MPGSAMGTVSSATDLSSVKLSEASKPFAVMSIETSVIGSSSYGSGRGGGVSVNDFGSGSVDPEAWWFLMASWRNFSHSSYRLIAFSCSLHRH